MNYLKRQEGMMFANTQTQQCKNCMTNEKHLFVTLAVIFSPEQDPSPGMLLFWWRPRGHVGLLHRRLAHTENCMCCTSVVEISEYLSLSLEVLLWPGCWTSEKPWQMTSMPVLCLEKGFWMGKVEHPHGWYPCPCKNAPNSTLEMAIS